MVLRYGLFYGEGSAYAPDGHFADLVRRRKLPIVGNGDAVTSFIHVEARPWQRSRQSPGRRASTNVVDDEPAPAREWLPIFAEAVGAHRPRRVPAFLVRMTAGSYLTYLTTQLRGASNAKAKRDLGWTPKHATWRSGFRADLPLPFDRS